MGHAWIKAPLGELVVFKTGKLDSNAAVVDGPYPFFTCSQDTLRTNTYSFDVECVLLAGNNANGVFPLKYFRGKFDAYQRTYVITPRDPKQLCVRYLYFALRPKLSEFQNISTGAATKFLTLKILNQTEVFLPSIEQQTRIASILGAYDDLIEVNRRRIALLEEMARRLFEEWFVNFRFPGHENHNFADTPDGPQPEGWSAGAAEALIDFDPPTPVARDGDKPFIPMNSLSTDTSLIDPIESRKGNSGAKFKNADTLFARITPCLENGKTGLVRDLPGDGLGFGSTEFVVMRGRNAGPAFTYAMARNAQFREHARRSMSGATGRQRVRTDSLRSFRLSVPPASLLRQFEEMAWPLLELSGALGVTNKQLAASRDLLLPRLISGEVSVTSTERELEAVA